MMPPLVRTVLPLIVALAGCASGMDRCRVGAECRSGVCRSDGTCAPGSMPDAGARDDAAIVIDAPMVVPDATSTSPDAGDASARLCLANDDGTIDRSEMPLRAGLHATFRVATDSAVDTAGARQTDGSRIWDLSAMRMGDVDVRRDLVAIEGTWYETEFPGAGWAARLSEREDLLGIFEIGPDALLLRGVVSPEDGFTRTLLHYDPAVVVLRFPLRVGDSWSTTSTVTGQALGVAVLYTETYASNVDASGSLVAPFGTFDVVRVRTILDRLVGALPTRVRSYSFASECFGTVATITSRDNETAAEFTTAAELARLTP
jgi:hypothetical protein